MYLILAKETIPHVDGSGKCYTYDPPFESKLGFWYGLRLWPNNQYLFSDETYYV